MLSDVNTTQISFEGQYISGEAKRLLTNITNNKYVFKGSTGIGGTTVIFNIRNNNFIIISPNVGMIQSKEEKKKEFHSDKQLFIYEGSSDSWYDVKQYLEQSEVQNLIINTTPDQIVNAKDHYYNLLLDIPLFIDEAHLYASDAGFRDSLGQFMELVYNEWRACFTLSTATPFFKCWDIPSNINIDYYKVQRREQVQKHLEISYDKKMISQFVYEQYEMGRKVLVFTNNKNIHTSFKDLRVANLVGDTLRLKLKPYGRGIQVKDLNYDNTDVLILSSSYFAGFDVDQDVSILIVSDQSNEAYKINVNNIVQAYGRCRRNVHQALLVNLLADYDSSKKKRTTYPKSLLELDASYGDFQKQLTSFEIILENPNLKYNEAFSSFFVCSKYVNRAKLMDKLIDDVNNYHLYNEQVLEQALETYGFSVSDYVSEQEKLYKRIGITFSEQLKNLMINGKKNLKKDYNNIKYNLKNKKDGTFSPKLALQYLTAYVLLLCDAKDLQSKLDSKRLYAGEFYRSMQSYLFVNGNNKNLLNKPNKNQLNAASHHKCDNAKKVLSKLTWLTDDWHMLYAIYRINQNQFDDTTTRELSILQSFYNEDLYKKYLESGSNRTTNTRKAIIRELKSMGIELNLKQQEQLKRKVVENFNSLQKGKSFAHYYNHKYLKRVMQDAIIFCLTGGKCGYRKMVDYREYNPMTALPKSLRSTIPLKYIEIDLSSANAQFIDILLNTELADSIYSNLMEKLKITRKQAKNKFNSTLNNHNLSVKQATKVYVMAGYPESKALELARMTAQVEKGSFFKLITQYEQESIEMYCGLLSHRGFRFHDAMVIKESTITDWNMVLPKTIKHQKSQIALPFLPELKIPDSREIKFHIGYYNAPERSYNGPTLGEVRNSDDRVESYKVVRKMAV